MDPKHITLDLSAKAQDSFGGLLSSDNYGSSVQSLLVPCDLLYTYAFRYGRLVTTDMPAAKGINVITQGPMIDYTATHPWVAAVITVTFATVALVNAAFHIRTLKRKKERADKISTQQIKEKLEADIDAELASRPAVKIHDINYYLGIVLSTDPVLKEKYDSVKIEGDKLKMNLKPAAPAAPAATEVVHHTGPQGTQSTSVVTIPSSSPTDNWQTKLANGFNNFSRKVLSPAWEMLGLTAFTYWIMWIGMGIFTGQFGLGISGVSPVIAFGIPILAGLAYPVIKVANYFKNRGKKQVGVINDPNEELDEKKRAEGDKNASELMRRALLLRDYELERDYLKTQLADRGIAFEPEADAQADAASNTQASEMDKKILSLSKGKWKKTAVTLFATIVGTYVGAQYGSWIVTDILSTVTNFTVGLPVVQIVLGTALMALAAGYGVYKAVQRYFEVKEYGPKISAIDLQQSAISTLEKTLQEKQKAIASLEQKLGANLVAYKPFSQGPSAKEHLFADSYGSPPTVWSTVKKAATRVFHFVNGACTGIFLARLLFLKGQAIALPFVAASFSNPVTIGVLVGVGVLYGAFKLYQYHQERKEEHAKALLDRREERLQCLKQEVELAGLREKLYTAQVSALPAIEASRPRAKSAVVSIKDAKVTFFAEPPSERPRSYSENDKPAKEVPAADNANSTVEMFRTNRSA
jgi:hypothetical protein